MAFLKYAKAIVQKPGTSGNEWKGFITEQETKYNLTRLASSSNLAQYSPDKYLLTHATIVSSVDVEEVPNVKIGEVTEGYNKINRLWNDYYITEETSQYINSNFDAWDRQTLLNTYKTFIGAENYCFAPGTKVLMHDGTYKNIQEVQVGDLVITHEGNVKPVVHLFERYYEGKVQEIYVDKFEKPIVATPNHPFFLEDRTQDLAENLQKGSKLALQEGFLVVRENLEKSWNSYVYNIEVEDDHSYVVDYGVLTRNCEHVQIKELSKGKIIDAVARDLGDTVYIDILVATDRKHTELIKDIESGKMNTLSMGCFLEGTPITMADGTQKPIETVEAGDFVFSHAGKPRPVLNTQRKHWDGDVVKIKSVGNPMDMVATDNHPFFVLRGKEECGCGCGKPLNSRNSKDPMVRIGHRQSILNSKVKYSPEETLERQERLDDIMKWEMEWVDAGELQVGDYLAFPKATHEIIPTDVTKDDARLLGYFLSEGNFMKDREGNLVGVEFTFHIEEEDTFGKEVLELMKAKTSSNVLTYKRNDSNTFGIRTNTDRELAQWFYDLCGEYSHSKKLREDVLYWPQDLKLSLLGAYLNGDGGAVLDTIDGNYRYSASATVSYDLWNQLYALFASVGIFCSRYVSYNGKRVSVQDVLNTDGSLIGRDFKSKRPVFHLQFNSTQMKVLNGYLGYETLGRLDGRTQHLREFEDWIIFPITEIDKYHYKGDVYNFEVEGDNSYVASGYAVHNCSLTFSRCSKCGNVAADDTQMCNCIKYEKGNTFYDAQGKKRQIAEICGHSSDPSSVTFIEASWVATPAFKGAVVRNLLNPSNGEQPEQTDSKEASENIFGESNLLNEYFNSQNLEQYLRTASELTSEVKVLKDDIRQVLASVNSKKSFGGFGDEDDEEESDKGPIEELKDDLKTQLRENIKKELMTELEDELGIAPKEPLFENSLHTLDTNTNILASFQGFSQRYAKQLPDPTRVRNVFTVLYEAKENGWKSISKMASITNKDIIAALYIRDRDVTGEVLPQNLYRCLDKVGGTSNYTNVKAFLNACELVLDRKLSTKEAANLITRAKLLK